MLKSLISNYACRVLDEITTQVTEMGNRSRFVRILQVQADKEKIAGFHERMKKVLDSFNVSSLCGRGSHWHSEIIDVVYLA